MKVLLEREYGRPFLSNGFLLPQFVACRAQRTRRLDAAVVADMFLLLLTEAGLPPPISILTLLSEPLLAHHPYRDQYGPDGQTEDMNTEGLFHWPWSKTPDPDNPIPKPTGFWTLPWNKPEEGRPVTKGRAPRRTVHRSACIPLDD